jgi:hypothetical protein
MSIDPSLTSLSIAADNKTMTSYDLRKFNKIKEFKLNAKVNGIREREDGYMAIVTNDKVSLCKEFDGEIKSLIEFLPKDKIEIPQKAEIVYDAHSSDLQSFRFLMISRTDLLELIDVSISQSSA